MELIVLNSLECRVAEDCNEKFDAGSVLAEWFDDCKYQVIFISLIEVRSINSYTFILPVTLSPKLKMGHPIDLALSAELV